MSALSDLPSTDDAAVRAAGAALPASQGHEEPQLFVIEPPTGWGSLGLGELWAHRELLYFLTWRDVKVRYKQTALGAIAVALLDDRARRLTIGDANRARAERLFSVEAMVSAYEALYRELAPNAANRPWTVAP